VLAAPYVLIGTVDEVIEELDRHRERWGFTSYVIRADAIDIVAPLIERLAVACRDGSSAEGRERALNGRRLPIYPCGRVRRPGGRHARRSAGGWLGLDLAVSCSGGSRFVVNKELRNS
jgi:hypothetical protein